MKFITIPEYACGYRIRILKYEGTIKKCFRDDIFYRHVFVCWQDGKQTLLHAPTTLANQILTEGTDFGDGRDYLVTRYTQYERGIQYPIYKVKPAFSENFIWC
jgi:hypothetical protein